MGAESLDIFPPTHSTALSIQEFKPVPSKKIIILGNSYSALPQFNLYIFLLKENTKGIGELDRANRLAKSSLLL